MTVQTPVREAQDRPIAAAPVANGAQEGRVTAYACWALLLLFFANVFNYVDRQIVMIVASAIQRDLKITDAQLGFLMGTAFATLYGMVGIGMGRIADALSRTRVLSAGLALWSAMTGLAGLAVNFGSLAFARTGVGIGEAIANPCSHALLADYFPRRHRSVVLGIYLIGAPLGVAAAMVLGGTIMQHWHAMCTTLPGGACRIHDWQAAFLIVGLPGLLLSLLVMGLREPRPRAADRPVAHIVGRELSSAIPPFTFFNIFAEGGMRALAPNMAIAGGLTAAAILLSLTIGDWPQWLAIAFGLYSVLTWGQVLRLRDRPLYRLTFGSATSRLAVLGAAMAGTLSATMGTWAATYAIRMLHAQPMQLGAYLGGASLLPAIVAAVLGGFVTDRWKARDPRAPIWMAMIGLLGPALPLLYMLHAADLLHFTLGLAAFNLFAMCWMGGFAALVQESVLPRMRGTASALFALVVILVSAGLGPYAVGKISTLTGSLTMGLACLLIVLPLGAIALLRAASRMKAETPAMREAWAIEAGEMMDSGPMLRA